MQAPSPVSVQAQPRNQHSNLNLKNKDIQRNLQNKDENKDNQTDLQKKDTNKENQSNLQNKDCRMNFTEKHCQINLQSADHYNTLQSFGTNIFSEILTETKSPCPVKYDNRTQPYQQFSFVIFFELNTSKNKKSCILTPETHSILPSSCTDCFESLKPICVWFISSRKRQIQCRFPGKPVCAKCSLCPYSCSVFKYLFKY